MERQRIVEEERDNRMKMKTMMTKAKSETDIEEIIKKYQGVIGRSASKWATKLNSDNLKVNKGVECTVTE